MIDYNKIKMGTIHFLPFHRTQYKCTLWEMINIRLDKCVRGKTGLFSSTRMCSTWNNGPGHSQESSDKVTNTFFRHSEKLEDKMYLTRDYYKGGDHVLLYLFELPIFVLYPKMGYHKYEKYKNMISPWSTTGMMRRVIRNSAIVFPVVIFFPRRQ